MRKNLSKLKLLALGVCALVVFIINYATNKSTIQSTILDLGDDEKRCEKTINDTFKRTSQNYTKQQRSCIESTALANTKANLTESQDFTLIASAAKVHAALSKLPNTNKPLLKALQDNIYPFFSDELLLQSSTYTQSTRGIVMSVGNGQVKLATHLITSLQKVYHSDLQFQLFYNGNDDLSPDNQSKLSKLTNVIVTNLAKLTTAELNGWGSKPFCILNSMFEETVLVDADTVFLQDPSTLFNDPGYKKHGTLFFKDRIFYSGPNALILAKEWISNPSASLKESAFMEGHTSHHMESGVVVINKSTNAWFGLLLICRLNSHIHRDLIYKEFYGDKETFWFAFEILGLEYYLNAMHGGAVGQKSEDVRDNDGRDQAVELTVCGHIGHLDYEQKPLWVNN